MPTTIDTNGTLNTSMQNATEAVREKAEKSHIDRIRSTYDTEDLGAIMGRFYSAVSWRNN